MKIFSLLMLFLIGINGALCQGNFDGDSTQNGPYSLYSEKDYPVLIGQFKDGKRDGRWLIYWENGNLKNVINYNSGIINGFYSSFYESLNLKAHI